MSTCVTSKDQLGKTSGIIVWKGRLYPRTFDFPYLVFDLDAWVRDRCDALLAESEAAFADRDYDSSDAFENIAFELSAWLKTRQGLLTSDEALLARSRVKPFVVNAQNFEEWMNRLVALGHELEIPELDFLFFADAPTPTLYSVTTRAAINHSGPYVVAKLVDQAQLEDKFGALMLIQSEVLSLGRKGQSVTGNAPILHLPISERWLALWHKVIDTNVGDAQNSCQGAI